jgi:hypothetical protein
MKRRLTLHIGLEKTGTDSFQRFCTEQRALLEQYGTLYPTGSLAFAGYSHEPLVACYLDYSDFSIRSAGRPRAELLHSLIAEIDRSGASRILISAEHLSSRLRDPEVRRLAADFVGFDCGIAVVVREHRARLFSAYSQSVLSGRGITLSEYCEEVFHPDNPYMRYAETIGTWERVFGRDRVRVFRHTPGQDIVRVLCEALIAPDLPASAAGAYWDNLSIGAEATEWLRRVNRVANRLPGASHPWMRLALRGPRRNMARAFAKLKGADDKRRWHLNSQQTARLNEIAERDSDWLKRHYDIRLTDLPADHNDRMNRSTAAK